MTDSYTAARTGTPRSKLTGINPRNFSRTSWWRFARDRRSRYLERIDGVPSAFQSNLIENCISLEWAALQVEATGGLVALREGREHRRLFQRLLDDFEATLAPPPERSPRGKSKSGPPQLTLDQHIAKLQARQESST
jgi:hypothetical protein